ncbi:MAG: D-alanyl-D-alanine carboxypeptidase [Desulfobacterales bacterium]|nr:D-alanyl-D-alanine carboxypeptidase [Desulfobacterales bacterium]
MDGFSANPIHSRRLPGNGLCLLTFFYALMLTVQPSALHATGEKQVLQMIGPGDALVLAAPDNRIILQKNATTPLIPASTLKLLSALVVMDTLGPEHRFETHFYAAKDTIKIKGFGDPLLISEIVAEMAAQVVGTARSFDLETRTLLVDDTYFAKPIEIPGTLPSSEPYDAPVGALCVNFNTVTYRFVNNTILSAEPQTPLLPFAEKLIRQKGTHGGGRIVLAHDHNAIALYSAHLVSHFLAENGVSSIERVGMAPVNPLADTRLLVYRSPLVLTELVRKMMTFSNNFVANQLVIAAGAKKYGPPGTLAKAVRMLESYCREKLALKAFTLVEGSGISRRNRLTALALLKILAKFEPYHNLLRYRDGAYFKTGTLAGVSSRAGYIRHSGGGLYRFVIVANTPGKSAARIRRALTSYLIRNDYP